MQAYSEAFSATIFRLSHLWVGKPNATGMYESLKFMPFLLFLSDYIFTILNKLIILKNQYDKL
jgi:hypothetical protein